MLNRFKIGIFDSGIGGLTVAKAISNLCPNENLLYIGDTAHMPWGDKSKSHIVYYATKITEFLIKNGCNIIVIACNTASANALTEISEQFNQIKLFNVIDPIILFLQKIKQTKIGIIGSKQTIHSGVYQYRVGQLVPPKSIIALATPILVPLIEEGLIDNPATNLILEQYLSQLDLPDQSMLILGCTHYPLIKKNIENYYIKINRQVKVIDGADLVANELRDFLLQNKDHNKDKLLNINGNSNMTHNFYVTDDSEFFLKTAKQFFANVKLEFLPLWG
jgi:glutamate racemase